MSIFLVIIIVLAILLEYYSRPKAPCSKKCDYPHCYHCTPMDDDDDEHWPKHGCC